MSVLAFALDVSTTVLVERIDEEGNWINPLVMIIVPAAGNKTERHYTTLFSEAVDPFKTPALNDLAIMGTYTVNAELETQYFTMVDLIKRQIASEQSGIVAPTGANVRAFANPKGKGGC